MNDNNSPRYVARQNDAGQWFPFDCESGDYLGPAGGYGESAARNLARAMQSGHVRASGGDEPHRVGQQLTDLQGAVSDLLLAIALCPIPTADWEKHLKSAVGRTYEQMPSDCHRMKGSNVYGQDGSLIGFRAATPEGKD